MNPEIIKWVKVIVSRMIREKNLSHLDSEVLIAAGNFGYSQALTRYDPNREATFKTFAEYRIKGAVLDEVRKMIGDERCKGERPKQVEDRDMSDNSRCQELMESHYDIKKFFNAIPLEKKEREILKKRIDGLSLKEIGEECGFTEARASQVLAHIKQELYPWFRDHLNTNFKLVTYECPECNCKIETVSFSSRFDCEKCGTKFKIENKELKIDEGSE